MYIYIYTVYIQREGNLEYNIYIPIYTVYIYIHTCIHTLYLLETVFWLPVRGSAGGHCEWIHPLSQWLGTNVKIRSQTRSSGHFFDWYYVLLCLWLYIIYTYIISIYSVFYTGALDMYNVHDIWIFNNSQLFCSSKKEHLRNVPQRYPPWILSSGQAKAVDRARAKVGCSVAVSAGNARPERPSCASRASSVPQLGAVYHG